MTAGQEHLEQRRWRQGRTVGRTLYACTGGGFRTHPLIGMMDTPELASEVCRAHNWLLEERTGRIVQAVDELDAADKADAIALTAPDRKPLELTAELERSRQYCDDQAWAALRKSHGHPCPEENYYNGRADAYANVLAWLSGLPAGQWGPVT